jgi:hypothetical protein
LTAALAVQNRACEKQGPPPVVIPSTTVTTAPPTATTAPSSTVAPTPTVNPSTAFPNCAAVRAAGRDSILASDPQFQSSLDSDGDGVGCELNEGVGQVSVIPSDAPETGDGSADALAVFFLR